MKADNAADDEVVGAEGREGRDRRGRLTPKEYCPTYGFLSPARAPLMEAARHSSDPEWSGSFYATNEDVTAPIEDLSG